MQIKKFRWSKVYESTEEELTDFLRSRNITAERWAAEAFHESEQRTTNQDITIWCAEGSLNLRANNAGISLQPGDGLHLPKNTVFEFTAGISGCVCYENTAS